ncbi:MAG: extracellular solute-binding protein, partial [Hydrogeniiclostridium sp.]
MKIKKLSATLVAIAMLASLASCSGGDTSSAGGDTASGTDTSSQAGGADAVTDGNYGGLVALPDADDPITYSIFVRDPGTAASDDNPVIQKIEELTGVSFEYEYLVGDLDTKLGTMVAGGDYPDVVFSPEGVPQFIESGAAIALEDKIPQYGNLNAMYNQVMTYLTKEDGHVYTMPIYGYYFNDVTDEAPTFECGYGFYIQKAVLEEAGYPEISTVDEYFDLIEDYMEKHPDIDGVKTSGFEVLVDGWRNWALLNPPQALMGVGNEGNITVDQETLETSFHQISDTAHDYYLKLNEEYRKGVITPETLTQTYDQYIAKITSGAVLGFFDQNWNFSNGENVLKTDGKYERTYVSVPLLAEGFEGGYIDKATGLPTADNGVMITTNCKDVDRLLT